MSDIQITDPVKRMLAIRALDMLWDAMELSKGQGGIDPTRRYDQYWAAYHAFGEMLVGEDIPEKEVLC